MRTTACLVLVVAFAVAPAYAKDEVEVKGTFGGFALGAGTMRCRECRSLNGLAIDFHIGHADSDKVGWALVGSGVSHSEGGTDTTSILAGLVVQYWPASRLWLAGGVGAGQTEIQGSGAKTNDDVKFALIGGAGVHLLPRRKFVLDLRARYGTYAAEGGRLHQLSVLLGCTWY